MYELVSWLDADGVIVDLERDISAVVHPDAGVPGVLRGCGALPVGQVRSDLVPASPFAPGRLPGLPVALAWVLGTVAPAGCSFGMKRARRD